MATISFITFAAGDTTSHDDVNSNFNMVNTYINDGIPNDDLANPYADVVIGPFTVDALGSGSAHHIIRMKPPLMNDTLVPVRAMISFDAGTGDATMDVQASGVTILLSAGALVAATADNVATADSFAINTISANQTLSFHIIESSGANTISGITGCLWCKVKHRE